MKRAGRRILRTGGVLVALLVAGIAALGILLGTEAGSRWLIRGLARFTPVSVVSVDGRMWDEISLTGVTFDRAPVRTAIAAVRFSWSPRALLAGELHIEELALDGLAVELSPSATEDDSPAALSIPEPPLPITLARFTLKRASVEAAGKSFELDSLAFGARWSAQALDISGFAVSAYGQSFGAAASLGTGAAPMIEAQADWAGELAGDDAAARLSVEGPLRELRFESAIDTAVSAAINGRLQPLASEPRVTLSADLGIPDLPSDWTLSDTHLALNATPAGADLTLATRVAGPVPAPLAVTLTTHVALDDPAAVMRASFAWRVRPDGADADITGKGHVIYNDDSVRFEHASAAPWSTETAGEYVLDAGRLDARLAWQPLDLSFVTPGMQAAGGSLTLAGTLETLRAAVDGSLFVPPVGDVRLNAEFVSEADALTITALTVDLLDGRFEAAGRIDLAAAPRGELSYRAHGLDLAQLSEGTEGRVSFQGATRFHADDAGFATATDIAQIECTLNGHALSGDATVSTAGAELDIERLRLAAGANRIEVSAKRNDLWRGTFSLTLPVLATLDRRLAGEVSARGEFAGSATAPRIQAVLDARNLAVDEARVANLSATATIDLAPAGTIVIAAEADDLAYAETFIGALALNGTGRTQAHTFSLSVSGGAIGGTASLSGGYRGDAWAGRITTLVIEGLPGGQWGLERPAGLAVSPTTAHLDDFCMQQTTSEICLAGRKATAGATLDAALTRVDLALLDPWLPTDVRVSGALFGNATLRQHASQWVGEATARVAGGAVERGIGDTREQVPIDSLEVSVTLTDTAIAAQAEAAVGEWFDINGDLTLTRTDEPALDAHLVAAAPDIRWIETFVPELAGSSGALKLAAQIRGTPGAPRTEAELTLADGALRVADIGLALSAIQLDLAGTPAAATLTGSVTAGDGRLDITGDLRRDADTGMAFTVDLEGERLAVVRTPEIEADVSPALRIAGTEGLIDITGKLTLPRVEVDIKRIPAGAVTVSEDEIVVTAETDPDAAPADSFMTRAVTGNVDIKLGENVSINGFGLSSRLEGDLKWTKKAGSPQGRANGVIRIAEGAFKAYGQQLEIQNGRLQFVGPIDNPRIDLDAVRSGLPVTAGVHVSGTVREPSLSLFSQPAMSDGNTLSYLVTGRALGEASASDANVLTQAALSLGAEESTVVTNQIRNTFGLDELSVDAGDTVRDTSLVAGKRLSPKLSVRTGFNPFDQLWSFFLNYKLTQQWSIEAESGERQGADVLYSIERNRLFD